MRVDHVAAIVVLAPGPRERDHIGRLEQPAVLVIRQAEGAVAVHALHHEPHGVRQFLPHRGFVSGVVHRTPRGSFASLR